MEYVDYISKYKILAFYGWWELASCLFAFIALLSIWYHIGKKQQDFGQVWLAVSVLCWSLSGIVEIYFSQEMISYITYSNDYSTDLINDQGLRWSGYRSILSLFNSLFILLSLPWFRYIPKKISALIHSRYWIIIVGLPFVFCLLPTLTQLFTGKSSSLISELDVYYSVLTLIFLGIVMWSSFEKRRLKLLAFLSIFCILIAFAAQILKLLNTEVNEVLFSAIFKTNLIMIFFALALSWVKELSENIHKDITSFSFQLSQNPYRGKVERVINLSLNNKTYTFSLSESNYNLLETFQEKRKNEKDNEGWLELKPKNDPRNGKTYEIQDYNQIKRLLQALLDGMYGKGNWSQEIHGNDLKALLLEKSEKFPRMIRLREKV